MNSNPPLRFELNCVGQLIKRPAVCREAGRNHTLGFNDWFLPDPFTNVPHPRSSDLNTNLRLEFCRFSQAPFSIPHLLLSELSGVTVISGTADLGTYNINEYSLQGVSSVVPQFSPFPQASNGYPNSGASRRPTELPLILPYAKFMTASRCQMSKAHNTLVVETRPDYVMLGIGFETGHSLPKIFPMSKL